jgi:putative transposase
MVTQGYRATLVAATLAISRSSLYYRKRPRGSRADRTYDEQIVMACGEKPAYGYRRVAWWLRRKENLPVNRKRVLRVMREVGCWCARVVCVHEGRKSGDVWKHLSRIKSGSRT